MTYNNSRVPIHLQQDNTLFKSSDAGQRIGATDHQGGQEVAVDAGPGRNQYRAPADRANGNMFFRRNGLNELDIEGSVYKIIDAIESTKQGVGINPEDTAILNVMFPGAFGDDNGTAEAMARINLRLSPTEYTLLRMKVAQHFQEVMQANMGVTGAGPHGIVPNTGY